jgi:hypothetical protein
MAGGIVKTNGDVEKHPRLAKKAPPRLTGVK